MKVLVTGATGFTGSYTVPQLLESGYDVRCFIRETSDTSQIPVDQVELATGDLGDVDRLAAALDGVDALVNIASIGFGHAGGILEALKRVGVPRAIFVGTTAIFTQLNAPSKAVRTAAEQAIMNSGIQYTILRPTMIYGSSRDRNICRLIRYVRRYPILPVFGSGTYLMQPIYVGDVAQAIVKSLGSGQSIDNCYNISGLEALSYNELIDTVAHAMGKSTWKLHLPAQATISVLNQIEKVITLPIKAEQIARLNEDKNFDHDEAAADFGFQPKSFSEGLELELEEMQLS